MSESSGRLPDAVAAKAREKTLLVLAKANSRSTVHRPAYLDYVGVKTFDENGEVVGERRFLGLFSSAAYTESLTRIPLLREKAAAVLKRSGFDPHSHAGKALMDTLETYPRDELFHTPVDELAPMAEAAMSAPASGARCGCSSAATPTAATSRCSSTCPATATTPASASGSRGSSRSGCTASRSSSRSGINESTTARVHFVVHPPKGDEIPDVDTADLERRLTEASRSWRDDFTTAVIAEYGEEAGHGLGRRYVDSFPEAYKEDFSAAHRRGRPRPARGDRAPTSRRQRARPVALRAARRRPGRGPAQGLPDRPPLSLSEVLPMLSSMGVEVVDERPYELEGLDAAVVHLRVRAALRRAACPTTRASCSRTRCARSGTATTRSTASTRWCSAPG